MPKLVLKKKAEVIQELIFKSAQSSYKIGSDIDNDLVIDDKRVSVTHALVERHGTHYFIRDMRSAFGTFVNGQRIEERAELKNGDLISLGDHTVVFENPLEYLDRAFTQGETAAGVSPSPEKGQAGKSTAYFDAARPAEMAVEELEASAPEEPAPAAPAAETEVAMAPYYLLAIHGPYTRKKFQLRYGETKIGRDSKLNDIIIRENKKGEIDPSISRRHATILCRDNTFYVVDKRSKTRTYVNQDMVPEDGEIALTPGDEIEIVSDQTSTIFRLVAEGNWDFSPPKRAGVFSVRMMPRIRRVAAVLAVAIGGILLISGYWQKKMITQRPDAVSLSLYKWASLEETSGGADEGAVPAADYRPGPALADFDGDGYVDLGFANAQQEPMLIDGLRRRPAWAPAHNFLQPAVPLMAADLNADAHTDLIYVTANGRMMAVDGKFGAEIWSSPYYTESFSGPPIAGDFDGDGWTDVAIAEVSGNLHLGLNRVTRVEWVDLEIGFATQAPLASADLDLDGDAEILAGTERGLVFVVDGRERKIAGRVDLNDELNKARGTFYEENQIREPTGIADLSGDGIPDLVVASVQGNILALDGGSRKRLWHARLNEEISIDSLYPNPFSIGDFDGDGVRDVVAANEQGTVRAFRGLGQEGRVQLLWQFQPPSPGKVVQNLAVCDLNKDRHDDVVYLDETGIVRILSGESGKVMWQSDQPLSERTGMPLIADIEKDGLLDIVLVSDQGRIYQYKSTSRFPDGAVVWGQSFGSASNRLASAFSFPSEAGATFKMAGGTALILLAIAGIFLRRRRPVGE